MSLKISIKNGHATKECTRNDNKPDGPCCFTMNIFGQLMISINVIFNRFFSHQLFCKLMYLLIDVQQEECEVKNGLKGNA